MSQQIISLQAGIAALLTDDRVDELIVAQGQYQIGDIFRTVENVLPGIDAAFINIGESEKMVIHVSDLTTKTQKEYLE